MWEWLTGSTIAIVVVILLVVAIGVGTLLWFTVFAKPIADAERAAVKHSHQYIESSRSRIMKFAETYETTGTKILQYEAAQVSGQGEYTKVITGLRAQQLAVLAQIKEEVGRLPEGEVPSEITKILNETEESDGSD